ncbi:MAG: apolipoprotein N-acyltransferase [Clostridia bacterium]|nr:apolipoprotein N-acyltransferase [Clostridia bacterium]
MRSLLSLRRYRFLLLLCSGVLMGLTLIFPGKLGFLQWVAFIPLAIALDAIVSDKRTTFLGAYFYGFTFFMFLYIMNYHWFWSMYPLDFTELSRFYALCVILLASLGLPVLAAFSGGFTFVFALFAKRSKTLSRFGFAHFLTFSLSYAFFEWTQIHFFTGVPWGRLAIGQTGSSVVLSSVSFLGSYFLSFIIVLVNSSLAYALLNRSRKGAALALASLALIFSMGIAGYALSFTGEGKKVKAAAVQGNMASQEKWSSDSTFIAATRYTELSEKAIEEGASVIVWPESVFPHSTKHPDAYSCVTSLTEKYDVELYYGCLSYDKEGRTFNAMAFASNGKIDLDNFYYKRHLVPFGEYVPLRDFVRVVFPMLDQVSMLSDDVIPGEDSNLFDSKYGKIGALICFDSIYEPAALDAVRDGAELIVIGTNDSWFFDSSGVYMHNAQAQIRACETGRYIVRSANTGVSSVIDARGNILDIEPPLQEGYVIADVTFRSAKTLYTYVGNLFVYIAIFLIAIPPVLCFYEKIKKKK